MPVRVYFKIFLSATHTNICGLGSMIVYVTGLRRRERERRLPEQVEGRGSWEGRGKNVHVKFTSCLQ